MKEQDLVDLINDNEELNKYTVNKTIKEKNICSK